MLLWSAAAAQEDAAWTHYGGSQHGTQYSSLAQINRHNVATLQEAWRYRTGEAGSGKFELYTFQANPIHVDNKLFIVTGSAVVVALHPANGRELWRFDPKIVRDPSYPQVSNRGVTAWVDSTASASDQCRLTIFVGTHDARLIALDGNSGLPCKAFGQDGEIRLDEDVRAPENAPRGYTITSPPVVIHGNVVIGSSVRDNERVDSELGIVRGIDARTGIERWRWDPIPRSAADPAWHQWQTEESQRTGAANAWAPLAADVELGLVYVPTGSASPDYYGGNRQGDNLYANSLVALNASTGKMVWYRQLVHHDVWDYDLASQPTLVDLPVGESTVQAVLQGTKTGHIFTFDRHNGKPLFRIEERRVPQGGVFGEHLSPTQPFPVAPPAVSRTAAVDEAAAWGLMYFDKLGCRRQIRKLRSEGIFTPPSVAGTIQVPGYLGGINWGGIAFDPARNLAVTMSNDMPSVAALIPRDEWQSVFDSGDYDAQYFLMQEGTPYVVRRGFLVSIFGVPCVEPPYGNLVAVDMVEGTIRWRTSFGTNQDITAAIVPNIEFGMPGLGGPIITGGDLIFIASALDNHLRAFDIDSGEMLLEARLPASGQATPMTYMDQESGRQFVVIASGSSLYGTTILGDYLVAYALPDTVDTNAAN